MTTQNYATVPYLLLFFIFFYQERIHDFQSPVLLNMKCIAHVMSQQDQWTFIYFVFLFFHATEISLELSTHTSCYATVSSPEVLNFPFMRHATLL